MTSLENFARNVNNAEISTKDLQLLLQQKLGAQVMVLKSRTSPLMPPGENFACSILKVEAVVKRSQDAPEEELSFVAKLYPADDIMRNIFDFSTLFRKEIFFYTKVIPAFQELQTDFGIKNKDLFEIAPKIFGIRHSINSDPQVVDDSTIILMENLKISGYYSPDKIEGLDLNHSILAIKALARFHALGVACKHHRPEFFKNEVLDHAKTVPFQERSTGYDLFDTMFVKICADPRNDQYRERIAELLGQKIRSIYFDRIESEPWMSITHFDLWTNNILYHKNEDGNLDDIKIIDFQNYAYNSPLRDLPYFLCTSTSREVFFKNFDQLLDLYYETFLEVLKKMHCNTEPFTRESFDAQLKQDCGIEFFHCILAIKFFYAKIDKKTYDPSQMESIILFSEHCASGYDKWHDIITTYVKHGWM